MAEQNRFSDRLNKTNKATGEDKREKQSKSSKWAVIGHISQGRHIIIVIMQKVPPSA
ncbi:MAG: hypothetical protein IKL43_05795 [Alistipes sp.]|nr:hypothetical protein [Alistipes sp.]